MDTRWPFWTGLLALAGSTHCAMGAEPPPTHFMRTKGAGNTLYVYTGFDAYQFDESDESIYGIPIELRFVTPEDCEISLQTGAGRTSGSDAASIEAADTVLTLGKGFRQKGGLDFLTVEAGYRFDELGVTSGTDSYFARARLQGGYTRLGFDASITWAHPVHSEPEAGADTTYSLGWRGQFGHWQYGLDVFTDIQSSRELKDETWASLAAMRRMRSGSALYGTLQRRLSSGFNDWFASVGYEFRFDLP